MAVDRLINPLSAIGIELSGVEFEGRTAVYMGDIGREINREALTVALGLEHTEYEPEQFPGLVYRPPQSEPKLLIFASGKALVVGTTSSAIAILALQKLEDIIPNITE